VLARCDRGRLRLAHRAVSRVNASAGLTWVRVMRTKRWSATVGRAPEPPACASTVWGPCGAPRGWNAGSALQPWTAAGCRRRHSAPPQGTSLAKNARERPLSRVPPTRRFGTQVGRGCGRTLWGDSRPTIRRPSERITSIGSPGSIAGGVLRELSGPNRRLGLETGPPRRQPLPAGRRSGVAPHESGEALPVVGARRRRHLSPERGSWLDHVAILRFDHRPSPIERR